MNKELDAQMVRELHFGGGEDDGKEQKSKKEVMEELIAKSKYFKVYPIHSIQKIVF